MKGRLALGVFSAFVVAGFAVAAEISMSVVCGSGSPSSPGGIATTELVNKLVEYSNGSIKATAFFDAQLGDARSMVQGLQQGTIDIGSAGNSYFSTLVPEIQVFELPFLFDGYAEARKVMDSDAPKPIRDKLETKGLLCLAFWEVGFRHLTNNVRPVKSIADVAGLKLRTLPAAIQVKTWENFGCLPMAIDSSELYSSLQTGIVVGQENSLTEIYTKKLQEVQKYMSLTGHVYTPMTLAMSMRTWRKLDDSQKEAVRKAAADATRLAREIFDKEEANCLAELEKSSLEIERNPDVSGFREKAKLSYDMFVDGKPELQALIDSIQAAK